MEWLHFPASTAEWAPLIISVAALGVSLVTFVLSEWRRWERIEIKTNFNYRINRERDQILFPKEFQASELTEGERCLLVSIAYHGRHSLAFSTIYYQISRNKVTYPEVVFEEPVRLFDGQKRSVLIVGRTVQLTYITAIVVHTESHGIRIRYTNPLRRWQLALIFKMFWLSNILRWAQGKINPVDK